MNVCNPDIYAPNAKYAWESILNVYALSNSFCFKFYLRFNTKLFYNLCSKLFSICVCI